MKGSVQLFVLAGFIFLGSGGLAPGQVAINVGPALPSDIAGGAPNATLQQAASFAWQEFIALNWPAMAGQRDVADPVQKFGASTGPGPLDVSSRRLLERADCESLGLGSPGFADEFIGGEAFEGFESSGEVVGVEEVLQVGWPMAFQSSSMVRMAMARKCALSLAKAISIGLRSGL